MTADTPFLISGLSKLITSTVVMLAVQEGLVSLDEPITTYLPEFKINSRYEEHPERKITLRRLLDCTAGLPLEAPLGNYFEPASTASFEDHVKSVYGSWLVCGAGTGFSYGSVSSDLAGYVIQRVSGKPFEQYVKEKVFVPLGMPNSTLDRKEILKNKDRAIGHMMGVDALPAVCPGLASGGMYSTARDYTRMIQLHINRGTLDGRRILDESLADAIHKPVGIVGRDPNVYYGMGIHIDKRHPERTEQLLWHDAVGFGFMSLMHWYPEYGIGAVVLTNRMPHPVLAELSLTLTDRLTKEKLVAKRFPQPEPDASRCIGLWWGWLDHKPTSYQRAWRKYCGTHCLRFTEYELEWWARLAILIKGRDEYTPRIKVYEKDGFLCVTESEFFNMVGLGRHVDEKLQEVKPGIFAAKSGITLDFTRDVPTCATTASKNAERVVDWRGSGTQSLRSENLSHQVERSARQWRRSTSPSESSRALRIVVSFAILLTVSAVTGCSGPLRLTAEDRRRDIEFLAQWARDYSPLVKLNEKHKGTPSYEALLPKYLEFAERAQSDEEFFQVVSGYFNIVGASGHAYLLPDGHLKGSVVGSLLGVWNVGITPGQFQQARYWPKLAASLSTRAHPPFRVVDRDGRYFTGDDWQYGGTTLYLQDRRSSASTAWPARVISISSRPTRH